MSLTWRQFMSQVLSSKHHRWTYLPLSTSDAGLRNNRKAVRRCWLYIFGAVCATASTLFLWIMIRRPYNPLDDYVSICRYGFLELRNIRGLTQLSEIKDQLSPKRTHSPSPIEEHAVVTSLYSNHYAVAVAVAVLGHSAQSANVSARYLVTYLDGLISERALCMARATGWEPHKVSAITPPHNGKGVGHHFRHQYAKLNIWALDKLGIKRLVYLDADTLVRRNFDELFDMRFVFGAVSDVHTNRFTLNFNAGVLALQPSSRVLEEMKREKETAEYPPLEAEQAFLNLYYAGKATHLPYAYNENLAIKNRSPTLWDVLKGEMRVVHYTRVKPFVDDSHPTDEILTDTDLKKAIRASTDQYGGFYSQEVDWWKDAYERMMREKGPQIMACLD